MERIALYICTLISCYIEMELIWGFMNARYDRARKGKYLYLGIEAAMILLISGVHILGSPFLYFFGWLAGVAICAFFLFREEGNRGFKRILECEAIIVFIGITEALGTVYADWVLRLLPLDISQTLVSCFEIIFSKIIVVLCYILVGRLIKRKKVPFSKMQYVANMIILTYILLNIFLLSNNMDNRPGDYLLLVNLGCIVIGDFYLLYFSRVINEKDYLAFEVKALEEQAKVQYEYYLRQEQNYHKTVHILHDVNKHVKSIEQLYLSGERENAAAYAGQIGDMLEPLLPVKYTGNPILDILLTDKAMQMEEKSISFGIDIDQVNLDFIEAIDVTTIFGNLLDNAIEACEEVDRDRKIRIKIDSYHEMVSIRMENSCKSVKWKQEWPVSQKGENRGIGLLNVKRAIEKYDGDIKMKNESEMFIVDIFLNA